MILTIITILLIGITTILLIIVLPILLIGINNAYAYDQNIDNIIKQELDKCDNLDSKCKAIISVLDNICQVSFFPSCFGDKWANYMS